MALAPAIKVLLAHPHRVINHSVALYFAEKGYLVRVIEQIGNIQMFARRWQPHIMLISSAFGDEEVNVICAALGDDSLLAHIPIIMLLNVDNRQSRLLALEAGVHDVISQPFDIEELELRIKAAVRLSTTTRV